MSTEDDKLNNNYRHTQDKNRAILLYSWLETLSTVLKHNTEENRNKVNLLAIEVEAIPSGYHTLQLYGFAKHSKAVVIGLLDNDEEVWNQFLNNLDDCTQKNKFIILREERQHNHKE